MLSAEFYYLLRETVNGMADATTCEDGAIHVM